MAPRWKGKDAKSKKDAEAEALKEPMSKIISQLQSSFVQLNTCGFLSDNCVHLAVQREQFDLLDKACFGRPVRIVEKDMYWFQLTLEESFYLCYFLKCLKINCGADDSPNDEELWCYFKSKKEAFPCFYKAYFHLRSKNWVVRSGAQYGVDFIVYRHHPARVHSEYGVLVLSHDNDDDDDDLNGRLIVWSDVHCSTRLLGSVAKTLLVLYINKNGHSGESPLCLANYTIEERTISRWSPEQCRERSI
jgi:tRNA-splicing endonuclease subunit Sen2